MHYKSREHGLSEMPPVQPLPESRSLAKEVTKYLAVAGVGLGTPTAVIMAARIHQSLPPEYAVDFRGVLAGTIAASIAVAYGVAKTINRVFPPSR